MNPVTIEYIRSLKPAPHVDGRELVKKASKLAMGLKRR